MSLWQPLCALPTPREHSPVTYFVLMDQRPHKACRPCSCCAGDARKRGLPPLTVALSHEREFTLWLPTSLCPPSSPVEVPVWVRGAGWGEPGMSPPLLLSQLLHSLGPQDVSPGPPGINEIYYQSPWGSCSTLWPFLLDSKSRFISIQTEMQISL